MKLKPLPNDSQIEDEEKFNFSLIFESKYPPDYESIVANKLHNEKDEQEFSSTVEVVLSKSPFNSTYIVEPMAFIQNLALCIMSFSMPQFIYSKILTRLMNSHSEFNGLVNFANTTPNEMEKIQMQAQEQTSNLFYECAFFSGIPVIIMTFVLGMNCTNLGRKTLMINFLLAMTLKFSLHLIQCMYPEWPDWLFYLGAFIDGVSGSTGVFNLSLYCYIADLTCPSSRSYRITLINSLNSMASLCVTLVCGYVIKYFGFFYLFLASDIFIVIALFYTIF